MWPFSKRRAPEQVAADGPPRSSYAGPGAGPTATIAHAGEDLLRPVCSRCTTALQSRRPPANSMLPPVYAAVVCRLCGWIDCKGCKGSPSDAPCTICGSPVMPAQTAFFE